MGIFFWIDFKSIQFKNNFSFKNNNFSSIELGSQFLEKIDNLEKEKNQYFEELEKSKLSLKQLVHEKQQQELGSLFVK